MTETSLSGGHITQPPPGEYLFDFERATITGFAGLYRLLGLNLRQGQGFLIYLIFSFQSFVTLILSNTQGAQSDIIRLLAASEAFIGAFFIALFVFALTRTIHR